MVHLPTLSELPRYRGYVYISPLPASCPCPFVLDQIDSYIFDLYSVFYGLYLFLATFGHLCGKLLQAADF